MMVAAHKGDLQGARSIGMKTAFIPRPLEYGPILKENTKNESWLDLYAADFNELAEKLGAW